ncbi:MAG: Unknown protein [uncultured Sulfurovum sp.]|uniref:Serine protease n=1 Tax=uncultured Sulfurovum sp. TaxID=269237 RepID=A0A6S6TP23_9BACT|nr:MAG: Unknown protein [uncultured Sulfurovum sp.]
MNDSILFIQSQDATNKSMGTGFVVYSDEGGSFVLTCYHVLKSVGEARVDDYEIEVVVQHKIYDLAVLYVKGLCNKKLVLKAISLEGNQDKAVSL